MCWVRWHRGMAVQPAAAADPPSLRSARLSPLSAFEKAVRWVGPLCYLLHEAVRLAAVVEEGGHATLHGWVQRPLFRELEEKVVRRVGSNLAVGETVIQLHPLSL